MKILAVLFLKLPNSNADEKYVISIVTKPDVIYL